MSKNISTQDISIEEWNDKLIHETDDWIILQYTGLSCLVDGLHDEIDRRINKLYSLLEDNNKNGDIDDDVYRDRIYPLEDEVMDIDIQLVSIEEEMDRRGIDIL